MTIEFTSIAQRPALYAIYLRTELLGARCIVYRYTRLAASRVITTVLAATEREALKQARREVRSARKCGGLVKA